MKRKRSASIWKALREALWATAIVLGLVQLRALIPYTPAFFQPVTEALADFNYNDLYYSDLRQRKATDPESGIDQRIVLINIGDQGSRSRAELAKVLRALRPYRPRVVGLDAYFLPRTDSATPALAEAMRQLPQLVMGVALHRTPAGQRPRTVEPQLRGAAAMGFLNFSGDDSLNTTIRQYRPFIQEADTVCVSWSAQLVRRFDTTAFAALRARHRLRMPQQEEIRYRGSIQHFPHLEAAELLGGLVDPAELRDKLVLLGAMGEQAERPSTYEDLFFTPYNSKQVGRTRPDMYGVVIEANIMAMLLDGAYITPIYWELNWGLALLVCVLVIWVQNWMNQNWPRWSTIVNRLLQVGLGFGLLYLSYQLYSSFAWSLNLTPSIVVLAFAADGVLFYELLRDAWRNTDASATIGKRLRQLIARVGTRPRRFLSRAGTRLKPIFFRRKPVVKRV